MRPICRLVPIACIAVLGAQLTAATATELRLGYTKPGHVGNYDVNTRGEDFTFTDAWDATTRGFADLQFTWLPGPVGISYGGGFAIEDRRRSPRTDGGGLPNYNNGRPSGFYGPVMKYQTYSLHAAGGPALRLADWVTLELVARVGAGLATLGIEYEGVASSSTNPYIESSVDLSLIFAEGDDSPFIGISLGGISSYSTHHIDTQDEGRKYKIYNQDVSGSIFIGYRF